MTMPRCTHQENDVAVGQQTARCIVLNMCPWRCSHPPQAKTFPASKSGSRSVGVSGRRFSLHPPSERLNPTGGHVIIYTG